MVEGRGQKGWDDRKLRLLMKGGRGRVNVGVFEGARSEKRGRGDKKMAISPQPRVLTRCHCYRWVRRWSYNIDHGRKVLNLKGNREKSASISYAGFGYYLSRSLLVFEHIFS